MMIWKYLHLLGVVLLLGNVIATGLWARGALAKPMRQVASFGARSILWADLWLTLLGGTLLAVTGLQMAKHLGLSWEDTPWLRHGAYALGGSTFLWVAMLVPHQCRLIRLARCYDRRGLQRVYRRWSLLGWGATGLLLLGMWVMVAKV